MLLLLLLSHVPLLAQVTLERAVMASGGDQTTSGLLGLSWTLGEPMTETYTASGLIVSQGFQQGGFVTAVHETKLPFEVEVFPNPTANAVYLTAPTTQQLWAELADVDGRVILRQRLEPPVAQTPLSMAQLPSGTYFLIVKDKNGLSNSFKILKF